MPTKVTIETKHEHTMAVGGVGVGGGCEAWEAGGEQGEAETEKRVEGRQREVMNLPDPFTFLLSVSLFPPLSLVISFSPSTIPPHFIPPLLKRSVLSPDGHQAERCWMI